MNSAIVLWLKIMVPNKTWDTTTTFILYLKYRRHFEELMTLCETWAAIYLHIVLCPWPLVWEIHKAI